VTPSAPPGDGPSAGVAPSGAADSLFRKLSWLTLFRLVVVTVLLGGTALTDFGWSGELAEGPGPLYALIVGTYLVSLAFAVVLRSRRGLVPLAYAQVALDVAIAAAVVSLTGGAESVFVFMFSLATVNGAILLYRRGAMAGAGLSLAAYLPLAVEVADRRPATLLLFAHGTAFVATAALASYLAEQLRRTGERLAERETDLAALSALHESIVQSVSSGLLTVDVLGRVTFLNRAGEQVTGLALAEVRDRPASRWFGAFEPGVSRGETDFTNARGERLRVGFTVSPLVAAGGEPLGQAIVFQDLTRLRAMEAMIQRSERLADLGRVAAGLAHELRNPLASMSGCIELLRANVALSDEDARLMEIVLREAGRLDQLVTRFLQFSRPAPPRREAIDLARVAEETLAVFARDPAAARVEILPELGAAPAWCDPDQLRQVLWNLLLNAAQAVRSEADGSAPAGRVRVATSADAEGAAVLEVDDDGPGIAPADLQQVFTPFFTTKDKGTGLGLATVQRLVDAHGGTVLVDSAPGEGTRFTVRLPAREALERAAG
jgi:two-component system sensor histidine kinase PilS (NtrC family)